MCVIMFSGKILKWKRNGDVFVQWLQKYSNWAFERNTIVDVEEDVKEMEANKAKTIAAFPRLTDKTKEEMETNMDHVTETNQYYMLEESVSPLCRLPYMRQLSLKQKIIKKNVAVIREMLPLYNHLKISQIIPSPVQLNYRSKDEFRIQMGLDGNPKTVGLFIGNYKTKITCISPDNIDIMKESHRHLCKAFQDFIRKSPALPTCLNLDPNGYWKGLLVRSNEVGQIMAAVLVYPRTFQEEEWKQHRENMIDFAKEHGLTSLYYQACPHIRCSSDVAPFRLLYGEPHIIESIFGYTFQISPDTFFYTNVNASKLLYKEVFEAANLSSSGVLLDLGCGAGVFSIIASEHIRQCYGIDASFQAIADAQANTARNDIKNCHFQPGTIETKLRSLLEDYLDMESSLTAVLNPGRAGVHHRVIQLIRRSPQIRKLVYVSCKLENSVIMRNITDLRQKEDIKPTTPFQLVCVRAVDTMPNTFQFDTILEFER